MNTYTQRVLSRKPLPIKSFILALFTGIFLASGPSLFPQTTLLYEDFEDVFPVANGWYVADMNPYGIQAYWDDVDSNFGLEGTPDGSSWKGYCAGQGWGGYSFAPNYQNYMSAIMYKTINFSGYDSAGLSFWYKIPSIESCCDGLRVYVDSTIIWQVNDPQTAWTQITLSLNSYVGASHTIKFEFYSDLSNVGEGAYLDNILVTGSNPDFVVESISLNPATPVAGQAFTATVVVRNQGAASGEGHYCDVWRNQPTSQTCGAMGNYYQHVGVLAAGATTTLTYNMTAPATAGSYTLRAFIDSACETDESNEGNNQTTLAYAVVERPDFIVQSITLSPSSPLAGQGFTATVVVRNQGTVSGEGHYCDVWRNQPTSQTCGALGNSYQHVGVLAAGATTTLTYNMTAGAAGAYTFRAFIDSGCETTESNEGNNQTTLAYTVVTPPDFIVESISLSPSTPQGGQAFTATVVIRNQGAGSGEGRWCDVWLNQPSSQSCGATGDSSQQVGALAAGATTTLTYNMTAQVIAGSYIFRAFIGRGCETTESSDGNNQATLPYTVAQAMCVPSTLTAISPQGTNENRPNIDYTWEADACAPWYELYVMRNGAVFADKWCKASDLVAQGEQLSVQIKNHASGSYSWWLRGWSQSGMGPWSSGGSFTVDLQPPGTVTLIAPTGGQIVTDAQPELSWTEANPPASWYCVLIYRNGSTYHSEWIEGMNSCVMSNGLLAGNYAWWVRAWNPEGMGNWSSGAQFTVPTRLPGVITQVSPTGTAAGGAAVDYIWVPDASATWYELYVQKNGGTFWDHWYSRAQLNAPGGALAAHVATSHRPGSYRWWVRGWAPDGMGSWSAAMSFSVP